jgi:3'(2'), 5'-bisphosphate nucleotidase
MIDDVIKISQKAGEAILTYYDDEIEVEKKQDQSPLTKADLAAHRVIVDGLQKLTLNIPILSEEGGIPEYQDRKKWKKYWLVDPLDGTKEFIKKNGEFTVNIALIENNEPLLGVVHIPAKKITYAGSAESGSFKVNSDGIKEVIYSEQSDLKKPLNVVCSRSHGSSDLDQVLAEKGLKVENKVPAGSSLKFCLVAEGSADIYPRLGPTMEWDTAAGDAVYRFSGKDGFRKSPIRYNKPDLKNEGFIIGFDHH